MSQTVGNPVNFYRVASMALFNGLSGSLSPGSIYEVTVDATNGIISWFRALSSSTFEAILQNAIASMAGIGFYATDKGTLGTGGTVTALPTSGVSIGDTYRVITAGTYGGLVCVVGDHIRAKTAAPTWEKKNGCIGGRSLNYYDTIGGFNTLDLSTMTIGDKSLGGNVIPLVEGQIGYNDSILTAFGKVVKRFETNESDIADRMPMAGGDFSGSVSTPDILFTALGDLNITNKKQVIEYIATQLTSMISLKGDIANNAALQALTNLKKGDAYRITSVGTFDGFVCEIGDVIFVLDTTAGTTGALVQWSVLQNNIDIATICSLLAANSDASKIMTNLVLTGGQLTPTYSTLVSRLLTGYSKTADTGSIVATDTITKALSRLENRLGAAETNITNLQNQLKWIEIT